MTQRVLNVRPCPVSGAEGGARRAPPAAPRLWLGKPEAVCPPLGDEETAARQEALFQKLTAGRAPAPEGKAPHLVQSIGPPGAGKSTVARRLVEYKSGEPVENYVELDYDALLDYFPEGEALREARDVAGRPTGVGFAYGWGTCIGAASALALAVFSRLLDGRYNLILHSHDHQDLVSAQLRGYVCTLLYVAVSKETAQRRAAARALELGRFLGPPTSEENHWGWDGAVDWMWDKYRRLAPWFALWADNFAVVSNEADGAYPGPDDFRLYVCHPPLEADQDWRGVVAGFGAAIAAAHGGPGERDKK